MTAKEYLNAVRLINKRINVKSDELYHLQMNIARISPQTTNDRVQSSSDNDPMKIVDKIVDLRNEINAEIDELVDLKIAVRAKINQLSDERFVIILTDYYINCKTWEQVATDNHYDIRYVFKLHDHALMEFEKNFL